MIPSTQSGTSCSPTSHPGERALLSIAWTLSTPAVRRISLFVLFTLLFGFVTLERAYAQAKPGCASGACVSSGTQLASANSQESELLNGLLGSLLGSELDVSLLNWQELAAADVTLDELQVALEAATPEELLAEPITLGELFSALNTINGLTDIQAIDILIGEVAALPNANQEVILGNLLQIESGAGSFTEIDLNALDLVIGSIQLFNAQNVATTPTAITVDGSALGLDGVGDITIQAQVIEPPTIACGPSGTDFYSAGVRVKLEIELLDLDIQDSLPLGISSVGVGLEVAKLDVYLDVASGSGIIQTLDAINRSVTVQATPGVTDIYVGTIADNLFFTSNPIDPASLTPGGIVSLTITLPAVPLLNPNPTVLKVPAVGLETYAEGTSAPKTLLFTGNPAGSGNYPQTLTASASASVVTSYTTDLLTHLEITANLEPVLDAVLGDVDGGLVGGLLTLLGLANIVDLTDPVGNLVEDTLLPDLLKPIFNLVLVGIADPLLDGLGIGLGQMDVTVLDVTDACPALAIHKSHAGIFAAGGTGQYTIQVHNSGAYTTQFPITVVDVLPAGLTYNSHTDASWVRQGSTTTFVNSTKVGPGSSLPPLVLTVNIAADAPGVVFNSVSSDTTGNVGGSNSQDIDRTVITGSSDGDGDGSSNDGTDPDPNDLDPCNPNPNAGVCDRDGDGLTNTEEDFYGTDPDNPDSDGDDSDDGPGLNDGEEVNGNPPSDPLDACDPNPNAAVCDRDGDGLDNTEEATNQTNPDDPDSDNDGLNDGQEVNGNPPSDPLDACDPNASATACDQDNDGLDNGEEETAGTDPADPDSDDDGILDGADPAPLDPCAPNPNGTSCPTGNQDFNYQSWLPTIKDKS